MKQTVVCLAALLLTQSAAPHGAAWELTAPLDYQVIQRTSREHGTVRIAGRLPDGSTRGAIVEARLVVDGRDAAWQRLDATFTTDSFEASLEAPAGGWYRVDVRASKDGREIGEASVGHVGIGEVFIVAGQSNSANHGEEKQTPKTGRVAAFDGTRWQLAVDPQPGASGKGGSFLPPFGDAVVERLDVPVGLVAGGIGATSVRERLPKGATFPNPPTIEGRVEKLPGGEWASKGEAFAMFVARMKSVGPHGFRAVLWHQGESDANQKDPTRTLAGGLYREYLEKIIRASRREIGWEAPWFVAQVSYHVPGDEGSQDIRDAQASLWRDGIALEGPDSDALKGDLRERNGQGVHFSAKGLREHGSRWADKVCPWIERELKAGEAAVSRPNPDQPFPRRLEVVNGDFSDLDGLTAGNDGWYAGLPKGWSGSESTYAVHVKRGETPPTCNPSTLGFFRQNVGTLDHAADVMLTFDVSEPWRPDAVLKAAIFDGNFLQLAGGEFKPGAGQELVAKGVPAGTSIVVSFEAAKGVPGLDNVVLEARDSTAPASAAVPASTQAGPPITVASYYFGNYHPGDPRNVKTKGKDWSEWELVKAAKPRFPGHHQPNVPLWGYTDESDPDAMAQKIAAAADHGIDAFIFDWYYYNDGPFLERPIDVGFLKAKNNARLKFALMWANHDWLDLHPYHRGAERKVVYPGTVTPENFDKICDHVIQSYFLHPSYWRIDGRPYFSFYELTKLLQSFGSVEATRAALDKFRARAVAAGLPGLHLNAVVWGRPILPGEEKPADVAQLVKGLGFDSVTSYVWIHHVAMPKLQTDYDEVRDGYFRYWTEAEQKFSVPYFPNVTMGWDPSPRACQDDEYGNFGYPFTNTISGNTPQRFQEALAMTKRRLLATPGGPRILTINCWNEWTEGSYLEPDTVHGMEYLEAVRAVFGPAPHTR